MSNTKAINLTNQSSTDFVAAFKGNDKVILKSLYLTNYPKIEAYVLQNSGSVAYAKDVYQESFLAVWKNIKNDKFKPENNNSINAYLVRVAKNKWLDIVRSKKFKTTMSVEKTSHLSIISQEEPMDIDDNLDDNRLRDVMQAFNELGEGCKEVLMQFYFEKKSMKEIAAYLNLDAASTRNKKYRCMQKLKEIALKIEQ